MDYKDALELQMMFTIAAQEAKTKNKISVEYHIDQTKLIELLGRAYPRMQGTTELLSLAKSIL